MEEAKNLGGEGLLSYQGVGTIDAIVLNIMVKLVKCKREVNAFYINKFLNIFNSLGGLLYYEQHITQ